MEWNGMEWNGMEWISNERLQRRESEKETVNWSHQTSLSARKFGSSLEMKQIFVVAGEDNGVWMG
jgi:hypothetical protein